jgi:transcriptional regulator with AAA-type ATPase domain/tetratricopeptide (TPR) repeat protein
MHYAGRLDEMLDSYRFRACFQGGKNPREGDEDQKRDKDARLGDLYLAVGNVTEALAYYKQALAAIEDDDDVARLDAVIKVSACLRRQGKAQEALSFVESVMGGFGGRCRRDLLAEKATLLCFVGRYGEAVRVCEEAQKQGVGVDLEKDARLYLVLGHVLARLCRWQQAVVCLEQAATFGRMCGDLTTRGNALNNLGIVYKNICRFRESATYLAKAVRIARRQSDDASLGVRLLNLANTLFKTGEIEKAQRAVLECQRIATTLNLARTMVQASICRARIEIVKGEWDSAQAVITAALAHTACRDDPRLWLIARETLADLVMARRDFGKARAILEECVDAVSLHAKDVEAELKTRLAAAYIGLGQAKKAAMCAEAAAGIAEDTGDLYEAGRALRLMAVTASSEASLEYISRAERVFDRIGARLELAITLHARSRLKATEPAQVAACLERAVGLFRRCSARRHSVSALCSLALAYETRSEHERALTCLAEAVRFGSDLQDRKLISETRLEVDSAFSMRLRTRPADRPVTVEGAVSMLRSRFGVHSIVLARDADRGLPLVVKAWGISEGAAARLAETVASRPVNPLMCSNVSDMVSPTGTTCRLGSLLAVKFGPDGGARIIVGWPPDAASAHGGTDPHVMVAAYYGVMQTLAAFETVACASPFPERPICIAGMITADRCLKSTLLSLPRIAEGSASILITGETGTGKELIAKAIHAMSSRRNKPFVVQNCAALPEQLLETELFGHKAGAFTGARGEKKGLLEVAEGGTFFLDEVGEVSASIQAKMLRAIETHEIRRVGDTVSRKIDARFLSATNKNLEEEVEAGRFRGDLYYRLNVVSVNLPPLRERTGDAELLASIFLERFARRAGKRVEAISDEAMRAMAGYDWPGNVRQLENEVEKAVTLVAAGGVVTPDLLSACVTGEVTDRRRPGLKDELRTIERRRILAALRKCGWNKTHAARLLGSLSRPALVAKMKRLGIPLKPVDGMGPTA